WEEYSPDVFLKEYESSHVNLRQLAAKGRVQPKTVAPAELPQGKWPQALLEAPDAEKWMIESIQYRDAAERFEANLARYASEHKLAQNEAEKLVTAVFKLFPGTEQSNLGTDDRDVTGMVGRVRKDIENVAMSG